MEPRFEPGDERDREALSAVRAREWHSHLTVDQFAARNFWLYGHPFGQAIETYLLRDADAGEILTSMDVLKVPLLSGGRKLDGILIASVVTPPSLRGRGLASRMLKSYFESNPGASGILHSDIGPFFYARFGFTARTVSLVTLPTSSIPARAGRSEILSLDDFCRELEARRRKELESASESAAVFPDPGFLDWQTHKYRFYAHETGRPMPTGIFRRVGHGQASHLLVTMPDPLASRLDLLWQEEGCPDCLSASAAIASEWGLSVVRFWARDPRPGAKAECPMIRVADRPGPVRFADPQLMDWW